MQGLSEVGPQRKGGKKGIETKARRSKNRVVNDGTECFTFKMVSLHSPLRGDRR